jgi:hypothetical protein
MLYPDLVQRFFLAACTSDRGRAPEPGRKSLSDKMHNDRFRAISRSLSARQTGTVDAGSFSQWHFRGEEIGSSPKISCDELFSSTHDAAKTFAFRQKADAGCHISLSTAAP